MFKNAQNQITEVNLKLDIFKILKHRIEKDYQYQITGDTKIKDFTIDSLDRLELLMKIEEIFDVNIPENLVNENMTVGEIITQFYPNQPNNLN